MDAHRHQTVKRLFLEARSRNGPERREFLDRSCGADRALREEVEELLAEEQTLEGFLEGSVAGVLEADPEEPASHPERVGAYRILRPLGWGGMGVVYLAEQESPRRPVALKLLRFDSASPAQLARFDREAEVLGRLSHPGIARVYEASWAETETGRRPYFAMEYVEGRPLLAFANEERLGVRPRVELLSLVAEAVHHAHEQGVVHRDLKPSNVLVDAHGVPRILDFGVALRVEGPDQTTKTGQLVGTLAYMSPEQAAGRGGIDARSDVFSLGVLGYELLTGRLPIATDSLPLHEAVRRIREDDPIPAGSVRAELRGDLEVVLAKALAKEPGRRYASAAEMAEDLRLWLEHRPIRARRAGPWYVARKLVRRHRALTAVAVALLVLLGTIPPVTLHLIQRNREFQRSEAQRAFYRELGVRLLERQELEDLERRATLIDSLEAPPRAEVEQWVREADELAARLELHRRERGALSSWAEHPESAPVAREEVRRSLDLQDEIIDRIEFLIGPRGSLATMRARLEALSARGSAGQGPERP